MERNCLSYRLELEGRTGRRRYENRKLEKGVRGVRYVIRSLRWCGENAKDTIIGSHEMGSKGHKKKSFLLFLLLFLPSFLPSFLLLHTRFIFFDLFNFLFIRFNFLLICFYFWYASPMVVLCPIGGFDPSQKTPPTITWNRHSKQSSLNNVSRNNS